MDNPFEMKLHTEEGGRFSVNVRKNYLEFIFEDGTTKAAGCLTRAELKDLAKICQYIWENSAPLMRKVKEEDKEAE